MTWLLGVDEAGYGPNLGPLVIAATLWEVPEGLTADGCDTLVSKVISRTAPARGDKRLWVADSKQIYKPGGGLSLLERHVQPFLGLAGVSRDSVSKLWQALHADSAESLHEEPWYATESPLPLDERSRAGDDRVEELREHLTAVGIHLRAIQARIVSPARFNTLLASRGTKGQLLSETTLNLVASLWPERFDEPALVYCDRHGGRSRYADLLQHAAGERMVVTLAESSELSRYRIGATEVRFAVRSERYLPVALASMVAKYVREVLMQRLNAWWCEQVPGLEPTAGYPVDAKRFWADTAAARARLGLADNVIWRVK